MGFPFPGKDAKIQWRFKVFLGRQTSGVFVIAKISQCWTSSSLQSPRQPYFDLNWSQQKEVVQALTTFNCVVLLGNGRSSIPLLRSVYLWMSSRGKGTDAPGTRKTADKGKRESFNSERRDQMRKKHTTIRLEARQKVLTRRWMPSRVRFLPQNVKIIDIFLPGTWIMLSLLCILFVDLWHNGILARFVDILRELSEKCDGKQTDLGRRIIDGIVWRGEE